MRRHRLSLETGDEEEFPSVNLTPLIDVVFVMLIVFILVAPVLEIDNVDLASGPKSSSEAISVVEEAGLIAIHVNKDNQITFNHKLTSLERLSDLLKESKAHFPDATPQLFHDKEAAFGTYQAIKNCVEEVGFESMDVVLKPGG